MTMKTYTNLKILFPYIKKSKRYLIFGIMGILIASAIVAPVPYFIGNVLDVLVKENVTFSDIKNTLILISAIYFVKFLINMSYQQSFAKLQQKIVNEIRLDMVKSILDAPLSFINKREKGYILSRIGEVQQIGAIFSPTIITKSTHNRRERPVCGHRGRSRGPFYYRITTFGKGPWDARDPHKTTFMALKHVIRLSIWQRQKETPGVEKAPGVSSPQRKESGRSGRDDGELRFGYDPAIHARRLRVYHRPRRLRMASRISIFFAARRFEPLNSMG